MREALPINAAATRIVPYALDNLQDLSPIAAAISRMPDTGEGNFLQPERPCGV